MIHIKNLMTTPVITVSDAESIRAAVQKMVRSDIGSIVVVNGKKPVGIITERDILKKVVAKELSLDLNVSKVMSKKLSTVGIDTSILEVSKLMNKKNFRRMIIVDKSGALKGIITSKDLMGFLSA